MKIFEKLSSIGMVAAIAQGTAPTVPLIPAVPLIGTTSLRQLVQTIIGWLLIIAGIIAVIYLIFGGYQYLTAGGDPERATKAKTTIINAIIGIIIIALSYAIYVAVTRALQGFT